MLASTSSARVRWLRQAQPASVGFDKLSQRTIAEAAWPRLPELVEGSLGFVAGIQAKKQMKPRTPNRPLPCNKRQIDSRQQNAVDDVDPIRHAGADQQLRRLLANGEGDRLGVARQAALINQDAGLEL